MGPSNKSWAGGWRFGAFLLAAVLTAQSGSAQEPPAAPYYSVQVASMSSKAAALKELQTLKDQPFARAEERGGFWVIRVGAYPSAEDAHAARDALKAAGQANARAVKISHPVSWLTADGAAAPAEAASAPATPAAAEAPLPNPPAGAEMAKGADKPADTAPVAAPEAGPAPVTAPAPAPKPAAPLLAVEQEPLHVENAGGAKDWGSTLVTFEQLGFLEGFTLEGSEGERRLFFPLPPGVNVARAQLVFDIEWSPLLIPLSSIQFKVNDSVRKAIRKGGVGDSVRVEIPLTAKDLEQDFVQVDIGYTLWLHEDICLSRKMVGAYARFSLGSGLAVVSTDPLPRTVRGAWSMLPRDVTVAARLNELSPSEFQSLFQVTTDLHREGFRVHYDNLVDGTPTQAHLVIAPSERYLPPGASAEDRAANLRLVRSTQPPPPRSKQPPEERAFILIDSTRPLAPADYLRRPWRNIPNAPTIDVATAEEWPQPRDADDIVRLKNLGFDDSERSFTFQADWHIALPFGPLGNGQRPSRVALEVYGPKTNDIRGPTTVSAYFNDRLVYSVALKDTGEKQLLEFELPRIQLRARNNLKIVAQRDETADNCKLVQAPYPLSIATSSVVETKPLNETPSTFAELVPHQRVLELYVERGAVGAAERVIPMLVGLGDHFWPDVPAPEVRLYEPGAELKPGAPFFVVGEPKWDPEAYVHFDQGRVRIQSNATGQGLMLLDFSTPSSSTVLQMVQAAGQGGAWLRSTAGYANVPAKRALFEDENVAFLGARGVQTALHVGPARDYRVVYPDSKSWFDATGEWRTVLFIVVWLIVVGLLLYLYLRTRRHGRK